MTNHGNARRIDYGRLKVFASSRVQIACALLAMMTLIAGPAAAQSDDPQIMPAAFIQAQSAPQEQANQAAQSQQTPAEESEITVPAGTRLSLALFRSISFKHTKPGDPVHLQVVFPVTAGNRMVIPPGTYVQGVVDAIKRGNRKYEVLAMRLRWADIIFATGYTVSLSGPLDVDPTYGALSRPVSPRSKQVPVMADTGPPTLPPLPPLPSLGPSPAVITGVVFGSLAVVAVAGVIWYHNRDFLMEAGTPVDIILTSPLVLDDSSVTAAVQQFSAAPPEIVSPPRRMRTCWTTGTPDYPSTPYPCPY
jgi:hypothetical protein